jgi:hypothetical protein
MEEGFKFIIPPPKYHPFPNILPILNPSFTFEKNMAAENPYHRLPEDNVPRPSMDSIPGDDQRLLATDPLYVDDSPPPKKGIFKFKLSYHPTFYIRLFILCLFICAFGILIAARLPRCTIPAIVFLSCAIFRSITVLHSHLFNRCFIRIHFVIVGRSSSTSNSNPKKWRLSLLQKRSVQLFIDWVLIIVLIITSIKAQKDAYGRRYRTYHWNHQKEQVLAGCILCWIAL